MKSSVHNSDATQLNYLHDQTLNMEKASHLFSGMHVLFYQFHITFISRHLNLLTCSPINRRSLLILFLNTKTQVNKLRIEFSLCGFRIAKFSFLTRWKQVCSSGIFLSALISVHWLYSTEIKWLKLDSRSLLLSPNKSHLCGVKTLYISLVTELP